MSHQQGTGATMTLVVGLPGAGKTTRARQLAADGQAVRLCPDEWMQSAQIDLRDEDARATVEELQWVLGRRMLAAGRSVVVEWGTWGRHERDRLREQAVAEGATTSLLYLKVPIETLVARVAARDAERPVISEDDLRQWARDLFEVPDETEGEAWDTFVVESPREHSGGGPATARSGDTAGAGGTPDERLDSEASVSRRLRREYAKDVTDVRSLGGGHWSRAYAFRVRDRQLVLRVGDHEEDYLADRHAARWSSELLPVPEFLAMGEQASQHWAITEHCQGVPLELAEPSAGLLADLLRGIWAIDVPSTWTWGSWVGKQPPQYSSWSDYLLAVGDDPDHRRTHGWSRRLAESKFGMTSFEAGLARLGEVAQSGPDRPSIVHRDLVNGNVLVEDFKVVAVFDWGTSIVGDPLYDVAWLTTWSPWFDNYGGLDLPGDLLDLLGDTGNLDRIEERMLACELHIALAHQAFNAFTGDVENLRAMVELTNRLVDR